MVARTVFMGGSVATMAAGAGPYGLIEDAALVVEGGRILWVGLRDDLPAELAGSAAETQDFTGQVITPGLIDCHTHLVFAGERAREFEARLQGVGYEAAARAGGGILSTVAATRAATAEALFAAAAPRLARLAADGATTVEIKSGYGLTLESELKMLRVARALGERHGIRVRTTLLAAHATPPEFAERPDAYIDHVIRDILPAAVAENLVDAVDAFGETIAFSPEQVGRLFAASTRLGLPVKLHADQLSDGGGAALAASHGALSADHLEYTSDIGVEAMARAGTVAVLLPGAFATVGASQPPPIAAMRACGVAIAVATDCNPGSSPLCSLLTAMNLACVLFRLTPEEALAGTTRNAAAALGIRHMAGTIEAGKRSDLAFWSVGHPREIAYWMGGLQPQVLRSGGQGPPEPLLQLRQGYGGGATRSVLSHDGPTA